MILAAVLRAVVDPVDSVNSVPDVEEFAGHYDAHYEYVWRTAGRFGVHSADLDDVVHEVFVIAYRRWASYDKARPLRPWLFGIVRRVASTFRKRRSREPIWADPEPPARASAPENEFSCDLWRALDILADEQREAFILFDIEGYSAGEVAQSQHVPINTVYSRVRLARARLKEYFTLAEGEVP